MVDFDNLKTGVEDFIIGVRNLVGVIQDLYTRIEDFTEVFDIEKTIEKLKTIAKYQKSTNRKHRAEQRIITWYWWCY